MNQKRKQQKPLPLPLEDVDLFADWCQQSVSGATNMTFEMFKVSTSLMHCAADIMLYWPSKGDS